MEYILADRPLPSALEVENLTWYVAEQNILTDINLSIEQGARVAIIGPNGAGKTSLLKCIAGLQKDFTGHINIAGDAITTLSTRQIAQRLAYVSQHQSTPFDLSVNDIVRMGLLANKPVFAFNDAFDDSNDDQHIAESLQLVGLKHKRWHSFNTLSGGEQQRVLIARSVVQSPKLLIMDEPTNHLDIYYQHQILALANELDLTLIFSIHNLELASQYADTLVLLEQGRIVAKGNADTVLTSDLLEQVFKLPCLVEPHPINSGKRITFAAAGTRIAL
ncbi:ABC transporter ATP-binding protein [Thalassotalea litorea]|uniref:ABC transporter ATP-binding protein n=1 Tax=Thalassotalea litorea TaxID=2020715 RepID=UPI0037351DED